MAAPRLPIVSPDLDFLLQEVAGAIQLAPEQHRLVRQHYAAVGEWLAAPGSPLLAYAPRIYPQGSMALETTVRPLRQDEYDLDFVCELRPTGLKALEVYRLIGERLRAHQTYAPMVELKNRCIRLNYAHNFHLDIIPAEPDGSRGPGAIWVPDRTLRDWTPSNPAGYVAWFKERATITAAELRKGLEPLPSPTPAEDKPALTIAVQLMKRRRDRVCAPDVAPRSIVLTTLAAEHYRGSDCVLTSLAQIVGAIQQRIDAAWPDRITVHNPTNSAERFCESFDGPGRYENFRWFIGQLARDVHEITGADGLASLQRLLADKFGDEAATRAIKSYGERQKALRDAKALKFTGQGTGGLSIVSAEARRLHSVPSNTYFGG